MRGVAAIVALAATVPPLAAVATNDEGSILYAGINRLLKSEQLLPDPRPHVFRIANGEWQIVLDQPPSTLGRPRGIENIQISGDGALLLYTDTTRCTGGSSCFLPYPDRIVAQATYIRAAGGETESYAGLGQISRNGRYLVSYGRSGGEGLTSSRPFYYFHDRQTGERLDLPFSPSATRQAMTDAGAVYGISATSGIRRWTKQDGVRELGIAAQHAIVNVAGAWLVYETRPAAGDRPQLRARDLASGGDFLLSSDASSAGAGTYAPAISNVGGVVTFLGGQPGQPASLYSVEPRGGTPRRLLDLPRGIASQALAGNGAVVFAGGPDGLFEIQLSTGAVKPIYSSPTDYTLLFSVLVPGTVYTIRGHNLTAEAHKAGFPLPTELGGVRVEIGGTPAPLVRVSPEEVRFQAPFELDDKVGETVLVEIPSESFFASGGRLFGVQRRWPFFSCSSRRPPYRRAPGLSGAGERVGPCAARRSDSRVRRGTRSRIAHGCLRRTHSTGRHVSARWTIRMQLAQLAR